MSTRFLAIIWSLPLAALAADTNHEYPIRPVPFTAVHLEDGFWSPRLETNRTVTIPYAFRLCEETGRIANFAKAGGLLAGDFEGIYFNDSDVFKVIEGAAYTLALVPDPALAAYLDDLISKIAAAQEDDGYLYTARTLRPDNPPPGAGPQRWSNLAHSHELYNLGHLYEAAVAHHQATGKRTLLDVALKSADLVCGVFGPAGRKDVPGHQEIEIGLARLYRTTGDRRCLDLAKFFLDERGYAHGRELYGEYAQDHQPVLAQDRPVGHAVRAVYMYCGLADVAALTGDAAYVRAIDRIWHGMVTKRLYLTGGIGARHGGEAFGEDYELPNAAAYAETCAAIANALWNERMFLLHGDAQYIDVLERVLYNGLLSGVALSGEQFFYVNPLASHGEHAREPWFGCACCPTNITRFLPSLPGYVYALRADNVYVNLFVGGTAQLESGGQKLTLRQETRYPWDGQVRMHVTPERPVELTIRVRVPGWARGTPVPGDLYRYLDEPADEVSLRVNSALVPLELERGYAVVRRTWQAGDTIELNLPMPVRRVVAHDAVAEDRGRVALERGPLVYCVEAVDHDGFVRDLVLPDAAALYARHDADLLGGVTTLRGTAESLARAEDGRSLETRAIGVTAVPYYAWNHRGMGEMRVWLPRTVAGALPRPLPTLASRSTASASFAGHGTLRALNDQFEPESSDDHGVPRMTWWNHRGTQEWVQYDFPEPATVTQVEVYWFDDTGIGRCRVPAAWRVLYREGETWRPVHDASPCETRADAYNRVRFEPVRARALRLDVQLQEGFSGGILEWRVR